MKCDRLFFITTVHTKHPAKHADGVILPDGSCTTFMLDTAGEAMYTYNWKLANASHIWKDGVVIRDSDYLFTIAPAAVTMSGSTSTVNPLQPPSTKIDQQTFFNLASTLLPHGYFWTYTGSNNRNNTLFCFDQGRTFIPSHNSSYQELLQNCSLAWWNDTIIKDRFGLFPTSTPPTPSYATGSGIYTVPPGQTVVYNISPSATYNSTGGFNIAWPDLEVSPDDEYKTKATNPTKKCKCGSHSVGSNKHSDYCDLFTKESA